MSDYTSSTMHDSKLSFMPCPSSTCSIPIHGLHSVHPYWSMPSSLPFFLVHTFGQVVVPSRHTLNLQPVSLSHIVHFLSRALSPASEHFSKTLLRPLPHTLGPYWMMGYGPACTDGALYGFSRPLLQLIRPIIETTVRA